MREHGTKTTPIFLPANEEASWVLIKLRGFARKNIYKD